MEISQKILSDIIVYMKYAKYLPEKKRRESWEEICQRNKEMHQRKYPQLHDEIEHVYTEFVLTKKVLPSMRSLQFAGKPIEINPTRIFNCSYLPIDDWRAFSEVMFLLLGGTGVGYSVQKHHVEKLPPIRKPNKKRESRYLVGDSIEGWADAIKMLVKSYFNGGSSIRFDYSDIRQKGSRLVTSGGKAPGADPLRICIEKIRSILDSKQDDDQLSSIEVHDIVCHIADAVLAGGIRRAALISLFPIDDDDMVSCKFGNWFEMNPQRGRANNSAVLVRHKISKNVFLKLWDKVRESNSGEPGIFFTNDKEIGTNPCAEISLSPFCFCNLTEVNVADVESQDDFNSRVKAASFIGTLQAGYTDFHYLRPIWKKTTDKDALLGVGMTGIASGNVLSLDMKEAATIAKETNEQIAKIIGINKAARVTTVKPSGTSSLVMGTSSGIHAYHSKFYIRRVRVGKNESIYNYLYMYHPELLEDDYFRPHDTAIISVPVKSPEGAITRIESSLDLLERVKFVYENWVKNGYRKGSNQHNVSCTVSLKNEDWEPVGEWMWKNRDSYSGISVLPFDDHTYRQAPFEDCTEAEYNRLMKTLKDIDLTKVIEMDDMTDLSGELACAGGSCEVV